MNITLCFFHLTFLILCKNWAFYISQWFFTELIIISDFRRISPRSTNNEKLVDIYKYKLYFYSLAATIVCSRNTVKESSHISFFCSGDPFCEVVQRRENTQGGADRSAWGTRSSLPSVQNYRPFIVFSSPMWIYEYPLHPRIFLLMGGYRNLHFDLISVRKYLSLYP